MKLTGPQLKVLAMLTVRPRVTTKHTTDDCIGGRVAACLQRMGLARWQPGMLIEITAAGRVALALASTEVKCRP